MDPPLELDPKRAVLAQVGQLGDAYRDRVHRPLPRAMSRLRLFETDALEALTRIPWWSVPLVWTPVIVALFWSSLAFGASLQGASVHAAVGLASWPLIEYSLHRFVFHRTPRSALGRRVHFLTHGIHHIDPWDPGRLVLPPVPALLAGALILAAASALLGSARGASWMAGVAAGYLAYDVTHYRLHHRPARGPLGRSLRRWHMAHHHRCPDSNFGVSVPVCDLLFGTGETRR